jgi:hypothetical protein
MVACICNHSPREVREHHEFKIILGYIVKPCPKGKNTITGRKRQEDHEF